MIFTFIKLFNLSKFWLFILHYLVSNLLQASKKKKIYKMAFFYQCNVTPLIISVCRHFSCLSDKFDHSSQKEGGGVYCFTLICLCAFCLSVCNVSASHPYEQLFLQVLEYSTHTGMPYHIVQSLFIPIELQLPVKMTTLFSF